MHRRWATNRRRSSIPASCGEKVVIARQSRAWRALSLQMLFEHTTTFLPKRTQRLTTRIGSNSRICLRRALICSSQNGLIEPVKHSQISSYNDTRKQSNSIVDGKKDITISESTTTSSWNPRKRKLQLSKLRLSSPARQLN